MRNILQNPPQVQITRFESCDSTNRLLLDAAESGAAAGSVFVAHEQTAGRGRRGRDWMAAPDDSLTFSVLWTFPANSSKLSGLSLAVGLAVVLTLSDMTSGELQNVRCGMKWPNDIFLCRADGSYAKAGGILIETALRASLTGGKELAVVIGIGLNCGDPKRLQKIVKDQSVGSISELFGHSISPQIVLPKILVSLFACLERFSQKGFADSRDAWNAHNLWQNQSVQIREGNEILHEGICRGVDSDGALCVETAFGIERIISGDVSLRKV